MFNTARTVVAMLLMGACCATAQAHGPEAATEALHLSDDLRDLLRAEMQEITAGSQALAVAIASGDWKSIIEISEKISSSYVMAKNLTDAQKRELKEKLPERFKRLDREFHARAVKLALAAAARDAETAAFQYSRLVESCAGCHAEYARSRFPGFSSTAAEAHHRH